MKVAVLIWGLTLNGMIVSVTFRGSDAQWNENSR